MRVTGRCHCGRITYTATIDPEDVTLCHCTDCQRVSGSAYRVSVPAPRQTFELAGEPKVYIKTAESGRKRAHGFCPECSSPIYSAPVENPATFSLRVGCLDQRADLPPRRQIWCDSALAWAWDLGEVERHARQ